MINISKSEIVLLQQGDQLRQSIVEALVEASNWIREAYGLQDIDLATVSTKTFIEAALPAHVERYILKDRNAYFDEEYVQQVWEFLRFGPGDCNLELYAAVTRNYEVSHTGRGAYRKAYLPSLRRGFAAFMVALHIRRAIVLPFSFQWPKGLEVKKRSEVKSRREICPLHELPELVRFIRSVDYRESAHQIEEVFSAYSSKQRERLVYMGQRLIVAAGWLELKDVNYEDMLAMKEENDETLFTGNRELGFLMLCDLLKRKFGDNSPVSAEGWREALKAARPLKALEDLSAAATHGGAHLVELAARILPTAMAPEALAAIPHLPGIEFNLAEHSRSWLKIQRAYIRQVKRENEKGRTTALGYFNVYLVGPEQLRIARH